MTAAHIGDFRDAAGFDLVCFFDCLHDMGVPIGAARHAYDAPADHGTVLLVEPFAGDRVEDNCNPVGRMFYPASTFICTPNSLSQDVGLAFGARAGEARLRDVFPEAGFTQFRRAPETPFNLGHRERDPPDEVGVVDRTVAQENEAAVGVEPRVLLDVPHQGFGIGHPPFEPLLSRRAFLGHFGLRVAQLCVRVRHRCGQPTAAALPCPATTGAVTIATRAAGSAAVGPRQPPLCCR